MATKLSVGPTSFFWQPVAGTNPKSAFISVDGPTGAAVTWKDSADFVTVDDKKARTVPCAIEIAPSSKVAGYPVGYSWSAVGILSVAGYPDTKIKMSISVQGGVIVQPPPPPPPPGLTLEPAIAKFYPECPYMPFELLPIGVNAFAIDGVTGVRFDLIDGNGLSVRNGTATTMQADPNFGKPTYPVPFTVAGLSSGLYRLQATVTTKGGVLKTISMPVTVGSQTHPNFLRVNGGTSTVSLADNVYPLYMGTKFSGGDRIFRYLGNSDVQRKDVCWGCTTTGVSNGFRNCLGVYGSVADGCTDDSFSNVVNIVACTDRNHNAGNTGNHCDEDQFESQGIDGVLVYGFEATQNVDGQGFSFTRDAINIAMEDVKFKTISQHWQIYTEGSGKNSDGHVNLARNWLVQNSVFQGGWNSWQAGGGTPTRCQNVVFQSCMIDRQDMLVADGVTFR